MTLAIPSLSIVIHQPLVYNEQLIKINLIIIITNTFAYHQLVNIIPHYTYKHAILIFNGHFLGKPGLSLKSVTPVSP